MHADELLDYALGRLRGPARERLKHRIARDPALAEHVARLARNLRRLLDDGRWDGPLEQWKTQSLPALPPALSDPIRSDGSDDDGKSPTTDSH